MSLDVSHLTVRGPGRMTHGGAVFAFDSDVVIPLEPTWDRLGSGIYGPSHDAVETDRIIRFTVPIRGQYQNLGVLFPTNLTNPSPGANLFTGASTLIVGAYGDSVNIPNAAVTGLPSLFLGVDGSFFSSGIEITGLIGSGSDPEESDAYLSYTASGVALPALDERANVNRTRWTATWGAVGGFAGFQMLNGGINLSLAADINYVRSSNVGTVAGYCRDTVATITGVPVEPTIANALAAMKLQSNPLGKLASAQAHDFAFTGFGQGSITLNHAFLSGMSLAWGTDAYRKAAFTWQTVRKVTSGVAQPIITLT